jgi:hypothetical protein
MMTLVYVVVKNLFPYFWLMIAFISLKSLICIYYLLPSRVLKIPFCFVVDTFSLKESVQHYLFLFLDFFSPFLHVVLNIFWFIV